MHMERFLKGKVISSTIEAFQVSKTYERNDFSMKHYISYVHVYFEARNNDNNAVYVAGPWERFSDWRGTNSRRKQEAVGGLGAESPEKIFGCHALFSSGNSLP